MAREGYDGYMGDSDGATPGGRATPSPIRRAREEEPQDREARPPKHVKAEDAAAARPARADPSDPGPRGYWKLDTDLKTVVDADREGARQQAGSKQQRQGRRGEASKRASSVGAGTRSAQVTLATLGCFKNATPLRTMSSRCLGRGASGRTRARNASKRHHASSTPSV